MRTHSHTLFSVPSVLKAHTYRMHKMIKYSLSCFTKTTHPHNLPLTNTHTRTLRVNKIIKHPVHHMNSSIHVYHQDRPESFHSLLCRCFLHQRVLPARLHSTNTSSVKLAHMNAVTFASFSFTTSSPSSSLHAPTPPLPGRPLLPPLLLYLEWGRLTAPLSRSPVLQMPQASQISFSAEPRRGCRCRGEIAL